MVVNRELFMLANRNSFFLVFVCWSFRRKDIYQRITYPLSKHLQINKEISAIIEKCVHVFPQVHSHCFAIVFAVKWLGSKNDTSSLKLKCFGSLCTMPGQKHTLKRSLFRSYKTPQRLQNLEKYKPSCLNKWIIISSGVLFQTFPAPISLVKANVGLGRHFENI